jgi:hypothetical protein
MNQDGEIDYSRYTFQELREALEFIRADQYPINYRNLVSEISIRPESPQISETALEAKKPSPSTVPEPLREKRPVTLEQLIGYVFISGLFLALGTYGLYRGHWLVRGEVLRGRELYSFFLVIFVAFCTNLVGLFSWIKNNGESGSGFRVARNVSLVVFAVYVVISFFAMFASGA